MNKTKVIKNATIILLTTALIIVLALFVVVPKVAASTGCFPDTNGHWAEEFICWLYDNGITGGYPDGTYRPENAVTRAEMAVFLQNTYDLAESNLSNSGEIWVGAGHASWIGFKDTDPIYWERYSNLTRVYRSSTGGNFIQVSPDLPTVLFGNRLKLKAVNFCYVAGPEAYIDNLWIRRNYGTYTSDELLYDATDRTDHTCRRYNLSTPFTLEAYDSVVLFLDIEYTIADNDFGIGQTSFIFEATATEHPASAPMEVEFYPEGPGMAP